jgi:ubiquitin-like 1-activating enzyme E1 A
MASPDAVEAITADEIALYDRQIRLWGVKAQESLRKANVLLISMKALANEVAKNLVLAGINSLTVADDQIVTEQDLGAQFFITEADVGKNVSNSHTQIMYFPNVDNREPKLPFQAYRN